MEKKKYSFKGTIIAVIVIIILILLSKFVFKEDFKSESVLVEPTEAPSLPYFGNTSFGVSPIE